MKTVSYCSISAGLKLWQVHPNDFTRGLRVVVFCYGSVQVDFTHIPEDYFSGTYCQWNNVEEHGWIDLSNVI